MSGIIYRNLFCACCEEETSHTREFNEKTDDYGWQCENCGEFTIKED